MTPFGAFAAYITFDQTASSFVGNGWNPKFDLKEDAEKVLYLNEQRTASLT